MRGAAYMMASWLPNPQHDYRQDGRCQHAQQRADHPHVTGEVSVLFGTCDLVLSENFPVKHSRCEHCPPFWPLCSCVIAVSCVVSCVPCYN